MSRAINIYTIALTDFSLPLSLLSEIFKLFYQLLRWVPGPPIINYSFPLLSQSPSILNIKLFKLLAYLLGQFVYREAPYQQEYSKDTFIKEPLINQ